MNGKRITAAIISVALMKKRSDYIKSFFLSFKYNLSDLNLDTLISFSSSAICLYIPYVYFHPLNPIPKLWRSR